MKLIRKKVLKFIKEHALLSPGDKVVIAFSGGADSLALLDILTSLPDFPVQVVIAHLNHCLRGAESDGDEIFVRSVAEKFALSLEISTVDIKAAADKEGLSLEEAGRNLRRSFFLDVAEKHSAVAIVLGHHSDDQAETVLMRLIRGAAMSGLTGMRPKSSSAGNVFVRPLLCLKRAEIEAYLHKGSLQWREDSSNTDTKFLRNRVRHELLPLLRGYNPAILDCLNRTAKALAADEELLEGVVGKVFQRIAATSFNAVKLDLKLLQNEPPALRKRLYRESIFTLKGDLRRISSQHLADIDVLAIGSKGSGKLSLPSGLIIVKKYNVMTLTTVTEKLTNDDFDISISSCGSYELGSNQMLLVEKADFLPGNRLEADKDTIFLELNQFPFPWIIRCFKAGDRFTPLGMSGRKKLKDLFIDKKIPKTVRKTIPLFTCRGDIFWVGGVQAAEKTRISEVSGKLLRLRLIPSSS